ncbi:MAG TPA: rhodanese-like domain-containing protein [Candidatus Limnocylindrales bacterium]|nr:rhodanese-like domain-containing protein [Candidatus Limnocylindrales bacterium]
MLQHHTITMDQLYDLWRRARGRLNVVDVRTAAEYGDGHVPDSRNVPIDEIRRRPARLAQEIRALGPVYIHCSSGVRAQKAYDALCAEGATNLTVIVDSGMQDWMERGYPISRGGPDRALARDLLVGIAAGMVASAVVAPVDRALEQYLGPQQSARVRRTRRNSAHRIAGPRLARAMSGGRSASGREQLARLGFMAVYAAGWGLLYSTARRRRPELARAMGLPFAGLFYALCDGVLAPALKLSPPPHRLPWQRNLEELGNHVLWTASAEMVHRAAEPPMLR